MMVAVDQVTSVSLQLFSVSHPLTEWLRFSEEQRGGEDSERARTRTDESAPAS